MEINEEKLKGILKEHQEHTDEKIEEYKEEIKRYFDVAREDYDSKIQLIAKQYESIIERLDSHDAKFASITEKLDSHDARFISIDKKLLNIEKNNEIIKADIAFIKGGLKKKVDFEEFEILERRVAILEAKK